MAHKIDYYYVSNIGLRRKKNQDNLIVNSEILPQIHENIEIKKGSTYTEDKQIFGVFDGLGGEKEGEVASYIAAKTFKDNKKTLEDNCMLANKNICDYMDKNEIDYMGTTAAILSFEDNIINLLNLGDSKIYRFSENIISQISVDHVDIAYGKAKPALYQHIGIRPDELIIEPEIKSIKYKSKDKYLICSDGLSDMLSEKEIEKIVSKNNEKVAHVLLQEALNKGAKDNITFIFIALE